MAHRFPLMAYLVLAQMHDADRCVLTAAGSSLLEEDDDGVTAVPVLLSTSLGLPYSTNVGLQMGMFSHRPNPESSAICDGRPIRSLGQIRRFDYEILCNTAAGTCWAVRTGVGSESE
jgi:hypothetical protein